MSDEQNVAPEAQPEVIAEVPLEEMSVEALEQDAQTEMEHAHESEDDVPAAEPTA